MTRGSLLEMKDHLSVATRATGLAVQGHVPRNPGTCGTSCFLRETLPSQAQDSRDTSQTRDGKQPGLKKTSTKSL